MLPSDFQEQLALAEEQLQKANASLKVIEASPGVQSDEAFIGAVRRSVFATNTAVMTAQRLCKIAERLHDSGQPVPLDDFLTALKGIVLNAQQAAALCIEAAQRVALQA